MALVVITPGNINQCVIKRVHLFYKHNKQMVCEEMFSLARCFKLFVT